MAILTIQITHSNDWQLRVWRCPCRDLDVNGQACQMNETSIICILRDSNGNRPTVFTLRYIRRKVCGVRLHERQHLCRHVCADRWDELYALRCNLRRVDSACVALDGLRQAESQIPDPDKHRRDVNDNFW